MTPFSASDAALEGFQLMRRRWRVILGWAGFNLLALIMVAVLSAVLSVIAAAIGGGAQIPALMLAFVAMLFTQAILSAGVFRLELRLEEPAFLHLRLGRDELRLVVVWLITITGAWVLMWAGALLGGAIGGGGIWLGLLGAAVAAYLAMRFLLAAPIAFAERKIDFVRSWRLTRGRVWPLLGMTALSLCLIALLMALLGVAAAAIAGAMAGLDGVVALFRGADDPQQHPGVFLLAFVVEVVLIPVLWVLGTAPVVAAYRTFAADSAAAQPA